MGQSRGRVKGVWEVLHSFLLPESERHYFKVLNCIIDNCRVKYFRTVVHVHAASFLKKKPVFFKLTIFFILRNNH